MKVLLYEPGIDGHRPVILRYLVALLPAHGIDVFVVTDPKFILLRDKDIMSLTELAVIQGCSLVHILTLDGAARSWTLVTGLQQGKRVPVVANYYLYNNLRGASGLFWELSNTLGYFDLLLISDPFPERRLMAPGILQLVHNVPDPWHKDEFKLLDMVTARRKLNLPQRDYIFLVFGQISARKGIGRILSALKMCQSDSIKLVIAGVILPDAFEQIQQFLENAFLKETVIVRASKVPEEDVGTFFSAANAVICDYGKDFVVSSGVFTRALASNRLPLVPSHGVNAEVVRRLRFGIVYKTEDIADLADAMSLACREALAVNQQNPLLEIEVNRRTAANYVLGVKCGYKRALGIRFNVL